MARFDAQTIFVTGGGSGMGRTISLRLANEGATVMVADINQIGGEETVSMIRDNHGVAEFLKVDISRASEVENAINAIVARHGRLDCAVNNAGVEGKVGETVDQISEEAFDRLFSINVKGTWLCMKYELIQMKKQKKGVIVNMSSVLGHVGAAGFGGYSASKHMIIGLTRSAAAENAELGIRINACCPAAVQTPMLARATGIDWSKTTPMKRVGTVEEVANATLWLLSNESTFTTGSSIILDGGLSSI